MFHQKATGIESRNLDIFLMGQSGVQFAVQHHSAEHDIAILEGVMGFYDGLGNTSEASSHQVSQITHTPVVLVVNAKGTALSVCATIQGFLDFEENNIRAVLLNGISSASYTFYRSLIEERLGIQVVGYLPNIPGAYLESRHLGLVTADEISDIQAKIALLREQALQSLDIPALLSIAAEAEDYAYDEDFLAASVEVDASKRLGAQRATSEAEAVKVSVLRPLTDEVTLAEKPVAVPAAGEATGLPSTQQAPAEAVNTGVPNTQRAVAEPVAAPKPLRIGISQDKAFCFYYQDNHDLLKALGAELVYFSPLTDQQLPDDISGLILWGGYPELYAAELALNTSLLHCMRAAIVGGLPVYAECGGFMYLQQSLVDLSGEAHQMLGVLPGSTHMTDRLQDFGYYTIQAKRDNLLCAAGDSINAHFFHHSVSDAQGDCFIARKHNGQSFDCIVAEGNVFAGYQHLHFGGNRRFAMSYLQACQEYRAQRFS
jgi:cobyrinic acid a,c-diamide synthase